MSPLIPYAITIILSWIISLGTTIFLFRTYSKALREPLTEALKDLKIDLENELAPMKNAVSRSMGMISSQASMQRKLKTAEKRIGEDLLLNYEEYIPMIETVSPGFANYIRENPEVIPKLLPRIQGILEKSGLDLTQFLNNPVKTRRAHPFGNREE